VGGVHSERSLADPGHPVHRVDADHPPAAAVPQTTATSWPS
jgi:hypothetical protein